MPKKSYNLLLLYNKNELEMLTGKVYTTDESEYLIYENGIVLPPPQECGENDVKCDICKAEEVYSILKQKCSTFKDYINKYGELNAEVDTWFNADDGEVHFIAMWRAIDVL